MNRDFDTGAPFWVVGFMSGTSLDAVDAAMIKTDGVTISEFGPTSERRYLPSERGLLQAAIQAARDWNWQGPEPDAPFRAAEAVLTICHAEAYRDLLQNWSGPLPALAGVHGQTVLHRAPTAERRGATRQSLDAGSVAVQLGLPLVSDLRSADVAAGGQGAPLAPAYHSALLNRLGDRDAVVLNLGGVANITARGREGSLIAFDTGPANGPVDEWVEAHTGAGYDQDGKLASVGRVNEGLLAQILDHPFFDAPPPKSLDRFDFNANLVRGLTLEDGAATLTELCVRAVSRGLEHLPKRPSRLIACGGGRRNPALMARLKQAVGCDVVAAETLGWRGDSVEAEAFALLAARSVRNLPISWPQTTGVTEPLTGGVLTTP
ncbi:MAG: anhydro-N-acetylmuramic acid kinase [Pseudomonadota bacterium]